MSQHPIRSLGNNLANPFCAQDKYDWQSMMSIRKGDDHDMAAEAHLDLEGIPGERTETAAEFEEEQKKLMRAGKISKTMTVVLVSQGPLANHIPSSHC